jgi:hypothetical protein
LCVVRRAHWREVLHSFSNASKKAWSQSALLAPRVR